MNISFDLWGTLIRSNPEFRQAKYKLFNNYNKSELEVNLAFEHTKSQLNDYMQLSGLMPPETQIWNKLLSNLDLSGIDISEIKKEFVGLSIKYPPLLLPDAEDILKQLSEENILSISSNTMFLNGDNMLDILQELKILKYFNGAWLFSSDVGYAKPHKEMFKHNPEVHVGDVVETDGRCVEYGIIFYDVKLDNFRILPKYICHIKSIKAL